MQIGMYCNWGVKRTNGGFFISAIHEKYIRAFIEKNGRPLVLLSKINTTSIGDADVFVSEKDVDLIVLPAFKSYLHAIKYIPQILVGLFRFARSSDYFYIRTFEPFSWILPFLIKPGAVLNYHFVANPFEAIWGNVQSSLLVKILRSAVFYPEFLLTCLAARISKCTCNGPSVLLRVPFFLRGKINVIIESTLSESDYWERKYSLVPTQNLKILFVGYLRHAKGTGDLLDSLALFKQLHPTVRLRLSVVGDGEDRSYLNQQVERLGLQSEVIFFGHLSGRALSEKYEENDIFVMPSHAETGPRVLLEAMARGMFCISTDVGYVRTVLMFNGNLQGILTNKGNVHQLCDAFDWYLRNPEQAISMAMNGFAASKKYSMNNFVDSIFK